MVAKLKVFFTHRTPCGVVRSALLVVEAVKVIPAEMENVLANSSIKFESVLPAMVLASERMNRLLLMVVGMELV